MTEYKPKRILLMYISAVSGHRQSAVAIAKALKSLNPDCEILSINGFKYTYPLTEKLVNTAYMGVIKRVPKIWEYLYDNPQIIKASKEIKDKIHKSSHKKIGPLIKDFNPDVVICTQAFPCGMVADYKLCYKLPFMVVGVLTDFAPHLYWLHDGVDYYVVPSEEAKDRYVKEGVAPARIKVLGIPIRDKFGSRVDRLAVLRKLGLAPELPTVLIMGGGQGLGPIRDTVKTLLKLSRPLQLIVIAGTNVRLANWLRNLQKHSDKKIIFYDFATNVDELMDVATVMVSKPGGMTTSECLVKGLPLVIINPIPGQEERNAKFLVALGVAVRVDDKRRIGTVIDGLLSDPAKLQAMRAAALRQAKPEAARNIARFVLSRNMQHA